LTNTSHRKQETARYEYALHWVLLGTTECCSSVWHSWNMVAILTNKTSPWTCAYTSATRLFLRPRPWPSSPLQHILINILFYHSGRPAIF
jgi:hypothetical protein